MCAQGCVDLRNPGVLFGGDESERTGLDVQRRAFGSRENSSVCTEPSPEALWEMQP